MSRLDNILNDDNNGTQVLPTVEQETKKLADEVRATISKISNATESAAQANDVELLEQIKDRLNGGSSKRTRRATTGETAFDKVNLVYLVAGGVLGFIVGMIIVSLLQTELDGTRFDSVSFWVSALVVLAITGFGVFLGSAANDKWRK